MNQKISIETLRRISYESMQQLVEDLNRNFAIIQNSPLFKGIPGDQGKPGEDGLRGMRGSEFLFVKFEKINDQFPGEVQLASQITLQFINSKMQSFDTRNKLLAAFGVGEFVNNDVIVLTDSKMLSYDGINGIFVDTGIAFNEQSNVISSINERIESLVKQYVDNNPTILSLQNIFEEFETLAKNFSPTNNSFVTNKNSKISGLFPSMGTNDDEIGVKLSNHVYFGFAKNKYTIDLNATFVIGSIERYNKLLFNTISESKSQTLNSSYIPTEKDAPAMVILQNNKLNGLWFGYNGIGDNGATTKRFASLFKNEQNSVVIKTDSGYRNEDYAELHINKDWMKFWRHVYFYSDFDVTGDYRLGGNIDSPFIRTEKYTRSGNANEIEIGILDENNEKVEDSLERHCSDFVEYENYKNNVLVCDENGKVLKTYFIEKTEMNADDLNETQGEDLKLVSVIPEDDHKVVTSNYLKFVISKLNNVIQWTIDNVWRKNQFNTGIIPALWVSNNLRCDNDLNVGNNIESQLLKTNVKNDTVEIGKSTSSKTDNSYTATYTNFRNLVFVTDENGNLLKTYRIEKTKMNNDELVENANADLKQISVIPSDPLNVVTSDYLKYVITKINNIVKWTIDNVWRKNQFDTGIIPSLKLSANLEFGGNLTSPLINALKESKTVTIGVDGGIHKNLSSTINYDKFKKNVLITDENGDLLNTYIVETVNFNDSQLRAISQITIMPDDKGTNIPTSHHINWLARKIDEINKYINGTENEDGTITGGTYWRKDQYDTKEIPSLKVSNYLEAAKYIIIGETDNPLFSADLNQNKIIVGNKVNTKLISESADINLTHFKKNVLVTNVDGKVLDTFSIEENESYKSNYEKIPQSTTDTDYTTGSPVDNDKKVVTSYILKNVWFAISNIKSRLKNTFNKEETIEWMYRHVEVGTIVEWTIQSARLFKASYPNNKWKDYIESTNNTKGGGNLVFPIPKGWVICDGRTVPGTTINSPNMCGRYTKMYATNDSNKATSDPFGAKDLIGDGDIAGIINGESHGEIYNNLSVPYPNYGGNASFIIPASALPKHSHGVEEELKNVFAEEREGTSSAPLFKVSTCRHTHNVTASNLAVVKGIKGNDSPRQHGSGRHNFADYASNSNITIGYSYVEVEIYKSGINKGKLSFTTKESSGGGTYYPPYYSVIKIMKYKSN